MAEYKLSQDASDDIERLFLFGIDRFGVNQATKYLGGLEIRLDQMAHSSATYPKVSHIRLGYRRSVFGVHKFVLLHRWI